MSMKPEKKLIIRSSTAEFLIFAYQSGGEGTEVRVQDGTVWLTQKSLGMLFETTKENIIMHLQNIFSSGELDEAATAKDFLVVHTSLYEYPQNP